jgi:glycosyltransferase involved in cell wall biosynthesis
MPNISVIVPVYNAEKYLHRCIDCILAQAFTDFELLLINDGSKDNSGVICDEYAAKDSRVRVFHKENAGASSARNIGLDNAKGKYICFVDSDDWVDKDYLIKLTPKNGLDFVVCTITYEGKDKYVLPLKECLYTQFNIADDLNYIVEHMAVCSPCCKIMHRDIIERNKIRFDTKVSAGEDMLFMYDYIAVCNGNFVSKYYSGYHYNVTNQSLSHRVVPLSTTFYVMDCLHNRLLKIGEVYNWDYNHALKGMLCTQLFNLLRFVQSERRIIRKIGLVYRILKNKYVRYLLYDRKYILHRRNFGTIKKMCINIALVFYRIFF